MTSKDQRPYISSRFVLELDAGGSMEAVGTLQAIEGGSYKSDVIEEKVGSEGLVLKYPGRPKFEEVTIQVGMAMAPRFWDWLEKSFTYQAERRDGALVALDFDNRERWRRTFTGALIKEVTFPTLDGAAKEPAYLGVKFVVEDIDDPQEPKTRKQEHREQESKGEWDKQRLWLPSMFTFVVDGLTQENQETCKIDGFTIKQEVIDVPVGGHLTTTKEPGRVDFPGISVHIVQRDAAPWIAWWKTFVRAGTHQQGQQRTGHIQYLKREAKGGGRLTGEALMTMELFGLGLLNVSPVKHESKQMQLQKIKLDLYCEHMKLVRGAGTVAK